MGKKEGITIAFTAWNTQTMIKPTNVDVINQEEGVVYFFTNTLIADWLWQSAGSLKCNN